MCSHVDPPPGRLGGFDQTALRSQWKALLRFSESFWWQQLAVMTIEIKKFGFHGATSESAFTKIKIVIDLIIFELVIMAFYVYAISINFQSFPYEIRCVRPLK